VVTIFELAHSVSTPLALSGFFAAVVFYIFRQIIARNLFPKLNAALGANILTLVIERLFLLALVAMILGFVAYILTKVVPSPYALRTPVTTTLGAATEDASAGKPMWPADKSLVGLRRKLDRISETNANIVVAVGNAGKHGIYVTKLSSDLHLPQKEVVHRLKELERDGLVEVLSLTGLNARLNEEVAQLLGDGAGPFLAAYMK